MSKFEDSKFIEPKVNLGLSIYKQLNNYLFDEDYKNLKEYLKNDVAPISFDRLEKARFYHKYGNDLKIINKEIVYEPLNLILQEYRSHQKLQPYLLHKVVSKYLQE